MISDHIGFSYLFLLRARVLEEGKEGTEKKVSAQYNKNRVGDLEGLLGPHFQHMSPNCVAIM
ncbi:hypothetical protein G4B88_024760 [Cannabis sativa]|uniref:Uncharacterized protein n=1 Tax=Cannabis sativa TaxID=3483 RepID=A0A7J6GWV0_CANSA|nr:hypothetical protein G4B88_024760 [Cannabis sativa]